jgi:hypothetical protein
MQRIIGCGLLALLAASCGGAATGRASGTCRITYGSRDPEPTIPEAQRTDTVVIDVARDAGDDLHVTLPGCELVAHPSDPPHGYVITRGHCHADVPGAGMRDFDVAARPRDTTRTEDAPDEASLSIGEARDVSLVFDAFVSPGHVRYFCNATIP